jgi:hypothetical protein
MSYEQDMYELFWTSVNEQDPSCEQDGHELCGTKIQSRDHLRIPLRSLFTSGDELETSCK